MGIDIQEQLLLYDDYLRLVLCCAFEQLPRLA